MQRQCKQIGLLLLGKNWLIDDPAAHPSANRYSTEGGKVVGELYGNPMVMYGADANIYSIEGDSLHSAHLICQERSVGDSTP